MKAGIDRIMIYAGLFLVLLQTVQLDITAIQFGFILFGLIVTLAGLWGLGARLKPERRVYLQLRQETDNFLGLVRRINTHAVEGDGARANEVKQEMHEAIELIAQAAGVEAEV